MGHSLEGYHGLLIRESLSYYRLHNADHNLQKICWLATLLYLWIIALVKCAIMLEWTRIFAPEGTNTYLSWSWYATGAAISLLSIILFIMDLVNCTPFSGNWDVLVTGRQCRFSVPAFGLASSIVNLTLEIIPLVLVQKVIWGLHMSWKKKLGVSLIFFIGIMYVPTTSLRKRILTLCDWPQWLRCKHHPAILRNSILRLRRY